MRRLPEAPPTEGIGIVEAPRGTLIHHYATDPNGILTMVNLIVATVHNSAPDPDVDREGGQGRHPRRQGR